MAALTKPNPGAGRLPYLAREDRTVVDDSLLTLLGFATDDRDNQIVGCTALGQRLGQLIAERTKTNRPRFSERRWMC